MISIKPSKRIAEIIAVISVVTAICAGIYYHNQQKGIDVYFKVVNFLSQPIYNWMDHRVNMALQIINNNKK